MARMRFVRFALKPHIGQVWFPFVGFEIGMQELYCIPVLHVLHVHVTFTLKDK